jgi:hypothetical protein
MSINLLTGSEEKLMDLVSIMEKDERVPGKKNKRYKRYLNEKKSVVKIEFLEEVRYELVLQKKVDVYNNEEMIEKEKDEEAIELAEEMELDFICREIRKR